jgi:hypothetical protein
VALLAGWVPPEDASKLEAWVAEMNEQLQGLLKLKHRQKPTRPRESPITSATFPETIRKQDPECGARRGRLD